jgi:hypothetical protein
MILRIVRSWGFLPALLILAALLYWKFHSVPSKVIAIGYVADRDVTLWNTLAQVREPVAEAHYGDRVEIMRVEGAAAQVRTPSGVLGWMNDSRQMMDSDLWGKSAALLERSRKLPVQARGRTKAVSNVRVEPGRDGKRIFQFMRGTPVLILERAVADAPQGAEDNSQEEKADSTEEQKPKQEDWLLVLRAEDSTASNTPSAGAGSAEVKPATGDTVSSGPLAAHAGLVAAGGPGGIVGGWVLARFVELDLPGPVKDYASSADLHVVAWFELNRVPNGAGGQAPQYLVAGSHGGEGQSCDFTMLRVYTWSITQKRYETAYVESDLCGQLPIDVTRSPTGAEFHFANNGRNPAESRYVMHQSVVRRVTKKSAAPSSSHR